MQLLHWKGQGWFQDKVVIFQIACGQADVSLLAAFHYSLQGKLHSGLKLALTQEEGLGNGCFIHFLVGPGIELGAFLSGLILLGGN